MKQVLLGISLRRLQVQILSFTRGRRRTRQVATPLTLWHVEALNHAHWQDSSRTVGEDVDGSVHMPMSVSKPW
jgi:hypothetical protein